MLYPSSNIMLHVFIKCIDGRVAFIHQIRFVLKFGRFITIKLTAVPI